MRIGIEAQRVFRRHKHGMDIYVLELIRQLQFLDTVNEYFIFSKPDDDMACLKETSNFEIVLSSGHYPIWEQLILPSLAREYKLDLLHCTSNTAPINLKIPVVITLHDIIYLEKSMLFNFDFSSYQYFGNWYRKIIVKLLLRSYRSWITVSHTERGVIEKHVKTKKSPVEVIYNGVSPIFRIIDDAFYLLAVRLKHKLPEEYIFIMGNTDPKKNSKRTIGAIAKYKLQNNSNIKIIIADFAKSKVLEIIKNHNAEKFIDDFITVGYIPNADVPAVLNMAKLFIFTSVRESFGIPIIEAMACGCPVLTSDTSCMPEVAGNAALKVDPYYIDDIVEGIDKLLNESELAEKYVLRGLERVKQFTWKVSAKKTLLYYNRVIEGKLPFKKRLKILT